jgi:hypothetical protein
MVISLIQDPEPRVELIGIGEELIDLYGVIWTDGLEDESIFLLVSFLVGRSDFLLLLEVSKDPLRDCRLDDIETLLS